MKTFKDLEFDTTGYTHRARLFFENGWGVSIVKEFKDMFSLEFQTDLYELAVLWGNETDFIINYPTGISEDVHRRLPPDKISILMTRVQELEDTKEVKKLKVFKKIGT